MSEVFIPSWIIPEEEQQEPLDEGSSVFAAAFAPGLAQRQSYGGLRLKLSRLHKSVRLEEKAQLLSILRSTRGRYNALLSKVHFALRGSFPATELLSNNTFANGTTGWTSGGQYSISVQDRVARCTRAAVTAADSALLSAGISVTQYAPHVIRAMVIAGRGAFSQLSVEDATSGSGSSAGADGLFVQSVVPIVTTIQQRILDSQTSGVIAGDYFVCPYMSLSRCALIDNGPNSLLRSDAFDNATWTKTGCTIAVGATSSPDGATAQALVDTTANANHQADQSIVVSSAASDYVFAIIAKKGTRNYVWAGLSDAVLDISAWFNLNTGAIGTNSGTNASFSNLRTFMTSLGDGWYACYVVVRKLSAATTLFGVFGSGNVDGTRPYVGTADQAIYIWRAGVARSSVPVWLSQTTTAATSGTPQTGNALHVKGLPVSTSGLLLPEDIFEINGELKTCTAALNSDAAGLGYLQFEPALFRSPADNDPVIILDPMGKFLMSNLKIDNEFGTQARVSYDLEHIYE